MNVLVFGATGMVGQAILRECLLDPEVSGVLTIGRAATGMRHVKLRELAHRDMTDYSSLEAELTGFDACFFCLGVSSAGMTEADYTRVTYDIAVSAAQTLARLNPQMTFVYVSGGGTDSSEKGKTMWARVKGRAENAILRLPLNAYMFRPGAIQPMHGARSRTRVYRIVYTLMAPMFPLLRRLFPDSIVTSEQLSQAMLAVARRRPPLHVLEIKDIIALSAGR